MIIVIVISITIIIMICVIISLQEEFRIEASEVVNCAGLAGPQIEITE